MHNHIEVDISVVLMPSAWQELLLWEERNSFWISRNVLFLVSGMMKKMYVAVKEQMAKNTRKQYCCSPICAKKREQMWGHYKHFHSQSVWTPTTMKGKTRPMKKKLSQFTDPAITYAAGRAV